jgi:Uma2 family endonuclease
MSAQPKKYYTPEEYLALERVSLEKHEYLNGEIFTMTGASYRHNVVCMNIASLLRPNLRKRGCSVTLNDLRVFVPTTGLYCYPDVILTCGTPQFIDNEFDTLLNPIAIIEVLSDSTELYDRTTKFENYRSIPSLQEYFLVSVKKPHIERYRRNNHDGIPPEQMIWSYNAAKGMDESITIDAAETTLILGQIYEEVNFDDGRKQ